jgi:hypothetical protein
MLFVLKKILVEFAGNESWTCPLGSMEIGERTS